MDIKSLITEFQNWDLRNLSKYADLLSTKTDDGQFFPPYIPFVGKNYEGYRILIYATAQNIPFSLNELSLRELYSKNFDKLVERLYYSCPGFERKYPENDLDFSEIAIAPYQGGVLPALAGVLIYSISQEKYSTFNEVQDHVAVSNYYKFSLHKKIDINPNHLESPEKYWELNDELALRELKELKPSIIITFQGRHVRFLEEQGLKVKIINDPAWILRGGRGCLKPTGNWGRKRSEIRDQGIVPLVDNYVNDLRDSYKGKKEAVKTYLLHYHLDWLETLQKNT